MARSTVHYADKETNNILKKLHASSMGGCARWWRKCRVVSGRRRRGMHMIVIDRYAHAALIGWPGAFASNTEAGVQA